MSESFRKALSFHIINVSFYEPRSRPSLRQVIATLLVMLAAAGVIVAIGMS